MQIFLAIFLPWILFFTIKRPLTGIICLFLQLTLIGWIPSALWAIHALNEYRMNQKIKKMEERSVDNGS